jgi:hypothetical protein
MVLLGVLVPWSSRAIAVAVVVAGAVVMLVQIPVGIRL